MTNFNLEKAPHKKKKSLPFEFVLELLAPVEPWTRPMFGCTAVYAGEKIVFILREKDNHTHDNGVWLATTKEHHKSLKHEFPSLRSIRLFESKGPTGWQNLPSSSDDFEESVTRACELVLKNDNRIGKIPQKKRKKR